MQKVFSYFLDFLDFLTRDRASRPMTGKARRVRCIRRFKIATKNLATVQEFLFPSPNQY